MSFERKNPPPQKTVLERRTRSTADAARAGVENRRHPYKDSAAHEGVESGAAGRGEADRR